MGSFIHSTFKYHWTMMVDTVGFCNGLRHLITIYSRNSEYPSSNHCRNRICVFFLGSYECVSEWGCSRNKFDGKNMIQLWNVWVSRFETNPWCLFGSREDVYHENRIIGHWGLESDGWGWTWTQPKIHRTRTWPWRVLYGCWWKKTLLVLQLTCISLLPRTGMDPGFHIEFHLKTWPVVVELVQIILQKHPWPG